MYSRKRRVLPRVRGTAEYFHFWLEQISLLCFARHWFLFAFQDVRSFGVWNGTSVIWAQDPHLSWPQDPIFPSTEAQRIPSAGSAMEPDPCTTAMKLFPYRSRPHLCGSCTSRCAARRTGSCISSRCWNNQIQQLHSLGWWQPRERWRNMA